ncbi:hypothetical protein [Paraburkholderia sp. GAS334]|uniref:hypothetical protein n=1 Tax=Paraburkholderia sp. GAS334 TaxID=3035131 RepID=UPI003D1A726D
MSLYLHRRGEGPMTVQLERWSIRRFQEGALHFVGFSLDSYDGRVSTKILELDAANRTGRTESGRAYILVGPAGGDRDAEYVWNKVWRSIGGGQAWTDVTEELVPGTRRSRTA